MSVRHRSYPALVVGLGLLSASAVWAGESAAVNVNFPRAFQFAGGTLEKGKYEARVESAPDGPTIVLSRSGAEVARDLAVVQTAQGARKGTSASVSVNARDEGRLRLRIVQGSVHYLAFFEAAK